MGGTCQVGTIEISITISLAHNHKTDGHRVTFLCPFPPSKSIDLEAIIFLFVGDTDINIIHINRRRGIGRQ